jgi:hypothetical protein
MNLLLALSLIAGGFPSHACIGSVEKVFLDESKKQVTVEDGSTVDVISMVTVGNRTWADDDGLTTMMALIAASKSDPKTLEKSRALFNKAFTAFGAEANMLNEDISGYCDGGTPIQANVCRTNLPLVKKIFSQDPNSIKDLTAFEKTLLPVSDLIHIGLYGGWSYSVDAAPETAQNETLDTAHMPLVDHFTDLAQNGFEEVVTRDVSGCGNNSFVIEPGRPGPASAPSGGTTAH